MYKSNSASNNWPATTADIISGLTPTGDIFSESNEPELSQEANAKNIIEYNFIKFLFVIFVYSIWNLKLLLCAQSDYAYICI